MSEPYAEYEKALDRYLETSSTIPHCDSKILHHPSECTYCARATTLQEARQALGIAFTGHYPVPGQVPCPADFARPKDTDADHRRWGGNKPTSAEGDPSWPIETVDSQWLYGDKGGRQLWPEEETKLEKAQEDVRKGRWVQWRKKK